ncbi:MAG: 23S rRNA (pseudouridine(1915)-N(3))-methyltransferase RlmH [Gemmatimonadales bacterium]
MNTQLLAVGKLQPMFREACEEYLARLRRYGPVDVREVKEAPASAAPAEQRRIEGQRLLEKLAERAVVVVLDREGRALSSEDLAQAVERWRQQPNPVALVIGGSTGLDRAVLERADRRWSLGPMTLPHQLARLVVLEQWYRAHTIVHGEKYHK